jgi:hypothetical protein
MNFYKQSPTSVGKHITATKYLFLYDYLTLFIFNTMMIGKEKGPSDAAVYRAYYSLKKNETLDQKLGGDG